MAKEPDRITITLPDGTVVIIDLSKKNNADEVYSAKENPSDQAKEDEPSLVQRWIKALKKPLGEWAKPDGWF